MPEKREGLDAMKADVKTLDAKLGLIVEKIRMIEKNEEVIGRTLVSLNEKVRKSEERGGAGGAGGAGAAELVELRKMVEKLSQDAATKTELNELRYVLDTINPLEYATIDQVRELIGEVAEKLRKELK
ncbi:MAG: hypothetical protein NTY90_03465 [Candidatus Micrarchaeota archaeon]|nr:hypothetical protein [Candidatus Micrarchaeota archaeon]